MDLLRKNYLVSSLLTFMKEDIEKIGATVERVTFDFTPKYIESYLNHPDEEISDAEDLQEFKKVEKFTEDEFKQVFNYCITNQYIARYILNGDYKVKLTDLGFTKAQKLEEDKLIQEKLAKGCILIREERSSDSEINNLLLEAKTQFLNNNLQLAVEKIWDAFERVKTLLNKDKKQSVKCICEKLGDEVPFDFFNSEYVALTNLGNKNQIRHFETDKMPIENLETLRYLFFRGLALINLTLTRIKK
ncbi:hypothetical protein [Candidatus Avelusimicrobium facis]|uniref:hypothetical protein n=1 Tax=Candidatus Avelusimicrobium facis TaxID=3416203 RepID=UPI003D0A0A3A